MPRLLVVDSDHHVHALMHRVGTMAGYEVESAYTGNQFIALYDEFRPEAVFIDLILPDFSGIDLIRWMELPGYPSKIIVSSAMPDLPFQLLTHGGIPRGLSVIALHKPLEASELLRALGR